MFCVMCVTEMHLVCDIANRLQYWISYRDVELQTLAVKICCNMSLAESQRSALAETGIFDSVFRKFLFSSFLPSSHTIISLPPQPLLGLI